MGQRLPKAPVVLATSAAISAIASASLLGACFFSLSDVITPSEGGGGDGGIVDDGFAPPFDGTLPDGRVVPPPDAGPFADGGCGAEIDLINSPVNCGRCGHACDGAGCVGGVCVATTLASETGLRSIAANATYFYSATRGLVRMTPPGTFSGLVFGNSIPLAEIALDTTDVFVAEGSGGGTARYVLQASQGATAQTPIFLALPTSDPGSIAVDATHVYWPSGGNIYTADKGSATDGGVSTLFLNLGSLITTLALDGSNLYMAVGTEILTCSIASCTTGPLVTGSQPTRIAISNNVLYFTDPGLGGVFSTAIPQSTGRQIVAMTSSSDPYAVAADATGVYWTDRSALKVMGCNLPCTNGPTIVARATSTPGEIAINATYVYWLEGTGGTAIGSVMRAPR